MMDDNEPATNRDDAEIMPVDVPKHRTAAGGDFHYRTWYVQERRRERASFQANPDNAIPLPEFS
jgi:hypothetical protein